MNAQLSFDDSLADLRRRVQERSILPLDLSRELQQVADRHMPINCFSDYHSGGSEWKIAHDRYNQVAHLLFQAREPHLAHLILQNWWMALGIEQQRTKHRYPLAAPTFWLAQIFAWVGDPGLAFRWALLTAIHDIQSGMSDSPALQMAQATFGFGAPAARKLGFLAHECAQAIGEDWSQPCGFPEEVVQRLMRASEGRDAYTEQVALHATRHEFPISPGYLRALMARLSEAQAQGAQITPKEKGDRLEAIARYLTSLLPGCVPRANLLSADKAFESDIVVANVYTQPTIISDLFGRYILVECKNYAQPVDVARVGYFLHRMRMVHAPFGIIFASRSVTGSKLTEDEQAARSLIRRAFHEDGSICVVVDQDDLERLAEGQISFYWLLHSRYEEFRFGTARDTLP